MNEENLLQKANNNCETAAWAENKKYFDVSISRYYYCLYEKAIYIAIKKGFYSYSINGKDSHNQFIANFQKNIESKLTEKEVGWLASFGDLKTQRILADYKLKCVNENEFNLGFKLKYQQINDILNRLAI